MCRDIRIRHTPRANAARSTIPVTSIRSHTRPSPPGSAKRRSPVSPIPIKGWWVYATNLIHALPNEAETIKAIQNLDLMVVVDVIPSEIAGWADVVLPESVYLERSRRSERGMVPRAVRRPPPTRGPAAARSETQLVDREEDGGAARVWARISPGRTSKSISVIA